MFEKRLLKYAEENFKGVVHTTLDPEGPGVVRIHLIPPAINQGKVGAGVAIINGQDIIPVNTAWTVLLCEFCKALNAFDGKELSDDDVDAIISCTTKGVRKVYPLVSEKKIRIDTYDILDSFSRIAKGEMPDQNIGFMSLGEYAPFMRAPHRMDLMVSAMTKNGQWHCNQKCVHCYAAGQIASDEAELCTDDWKKIIDKCREIGVPQLTFTGGEPTMRDDLFELIDYASWFVTRMNTNGIKLTKDYCQRLKDVSLDSLQITFYSNKKEIHNKLVGADKWDDTVNGIKNALETGLSVSINTPLCQLNKDYINTLKFLKELGVRYVTCSGLITTGNAGTGSSEAVQLSVDEVKNVLREATEFAFANGMEISFTSPGWIDKAFCEELGITMPSCGACLSNMAITPSGNVVPCQSWLSDRALGNMLTDKWFDIWNSKLCEERRDYSAMMTGKCPLRKELKNAK